MRVPVNNMVHSADLLVSANIRVSVPDITDELFRGYARILALVKFALIPQLYCCVHTLQIGLLHSGSSNRTIYMRRSE